MFPLMFLFWPRKKIVTIFVECAECQQSYLTVFRRWHALVGGLDQGTCPQCQHVNGWRRLRRAR